LGRISSTFAPSISDPSWVILPLIMAIRFEDSSCQMIADNLSEGGVVLASRGARSEVCPGFWEAGAGFSMVALFGGSFWVTEGAE
jgi:hypothetical protein